MPIGSSATPLLALDAVVIDTETTGLDARKARIVEIALVPIVGGRLDAAAACRRLIRPDVAIPAQATRIHGIDAAAVADAPRFAEAWPELAALIGERVVIGHAVGFDLTVLHARMRARRPAMDAPARVGHAASRRGRRAGPRRLLARERCRVARDRGHRSAFRLGRCVGGGARVPGAAAEAARRRASARWRKPSGPAMRSPTRSTSSTAPGGSSRAAALAPSMPAGHRCAWTATPTAIA